MRDLDPQTEATLEELIVFRDDISSRREQLLNSEDGKDPRSVLFIDSLIQVLDLLIENAASTKDQPQGAIDQAQYQELLAKTVFKVQQDPLEPLKVPAPPADGGQEKRK